MMLQLLLQPVSAFASLRMFFLIARWLLPLRYVTHDVLRMTCDV
jgi:hypothetical protein